MITESLLGEAEIDDEGNIDVNEESLVRRSVALCDSEVIPRSAKFGMPALYAMTCMLFLSSNLSVGAAVQVRAFKRELAPSDAGDVDILLPEVFTFSLMDTVSNMWRALAQYALSALILSFSEYGPTRNCSQCGPRGRRRGRLRRIVDDFSNASTPPENGL